VVSHPDRPQSNQAHLTVLQYYNMHVVVLVAVVVNIVILVIYFFLTKEDNKFAVLAAHGKSNQLPANSQITTIAIFCATERVHHSNQEVPAFV